MPRLAMEDYSIVLLISEETSGPRLDCLNPAYFDQINKFFELATAAVSIRLHISEHA